MTDVEDVPRAEAPPDGHAPSARQRWAGLGVVLVGTLIVSLDSTIVGVALAQIGRAMDAGQGIQWVVTANLLSVAVSLPAAGWLADRFGAKQVFLLALAAFSVASLGAALSPGLGVLVCFRALQGLAAGVINPISMTIVLDLFPPSERGRAMGVWGLVAMSAPAVGPTLGGYLVDAVSWHWLFIPDVPLGLAGAVLGRRLLVASPRRPRRPLDVPGLVLGATGLALFLFALAQSRRWGWGSPAIVGGLAIALVLLTAFVRHAGRVEHPLLELGLLRTPMFRTSLAVISVVTLPQYARAVFIPLELQQMRGLSALRVGAIMTPSAIATALSMAIGGRLVDRAGARLPAMAGCTLMLLGAAGNAFSTPTTSLGWIAAYLTVQGLGVGMVMIPATVVGLNALRDESLTQGSALRSLANQAGAAVAVAVMFAVVNARLASAGDAVARQHAYNSAFGLAMGALVLGIVLSSRLATRPTATSSTA